MTWYSRNSPEWSDAVQALFYVALQTSFYSHGGSGGSADWDSTTTDWDSLLVDWDGITGEVAGIWYELLDSSWFLQTLLNYISKNNTIYEEAQQTSYMTENGSAWRSKQSNSWYTENNTSL